MTYEEMEAYQHDAEDRYDNFGPDYIEDDEDAVYVVEDSFDGYDYVTDEYDGYDGNQVGKLDPNDATYTIIVNNTTTADHEVVLFGANEGVEPPTGVTIDCAESSHNEVRRESQSNPFVISGMKMSVEDTSQFDNVLYLVEKTSAGRTTTYVKQPRNWQSPQNQDKNLISALDFEFGVNGKSSIRFTAKPGRTVFTFSVKLRTNLANVLDGRNVAEVNSTPMTTGLPQIDLMRLSQSAPAMGKRALPAPQAPRTVKKVRMVKPAGGAAQRIRGGAKRLGGRVAQGDQRKLLKLRR